MAHRLHPLVRRREASRAFDLSVRVTPARRYLPIDLPTLLHVMPYVSRNRSESEADARTRTGDPFITSEVLYQLSYVGRRLSLAPAFPGLFELLVLAVPLVVRFGLGVSVGV